MRSRGPAPASVDHASVGPGSPRPAPMAQVVVGAEERVEPAVLGRPRDPRAGRRRSAPCWGSVKILRSTGRRLGPAEALRSAGSGVMHRCRHGPGQWRSRPSRLAGGPAARRLGAVSVAPDGRKLLRLEVRNAQTPIETQAGRGSGPGRGPARSTPSCTSLVSPGGPAHGVPGGRLPQHLRVLGGPGGDLPHRRRDQCTRRCDFCQIDTGRPAAAGPRRATPGRRVGAHDGAALLDGHRRRPRRPARRRRLAVRRDRAPDPRAATPAPASSC